MTKKVTHTKTCCSASFLIPSGFCSSRRVRICCASTTVKIASKVNFSCMDGSIKNVWTTGAGSACVVDVLCIGFMVRYGMLLIVVISKNKNRKTEKKD